MPLLHRILPFPSPALVTENKELSSRPSWNFPLMYDELEEIVIDPIAMALGKRPVAALNLKLSISKREVISQRAT